MKKSHKCSELIKYSAHFSFRLIKLHGDRSHSFSVQVQEDSSGSSIHERRTQTEVRGQNRALKVLSG